METILTNVTTLEKRIAQQQRPAGRVVMYQTWEDLLFLHWSMPAEVLQAKLPPGLRVDTFDGQAWVGIVPFFMRNIRPSWSPAIPGISNFQEVNLRTYVVDETGVPGVWFLSLDADTQLGVWWGRTLFRLPYHRAQMSHRRDRKTGRVEFNSQRRGTGPELASRFTWEPSGVPRTARPGTLEFFLVERYVLFADIGDRRIARGQVHHAPYEIFDAVATGNDPLFELNGLPRPGCGPEHVLLCRGVDVEIFALQIPGKEW